MSNSIRSAISEGARALDAAGVNEARKEATSLMSHALESDRTFVIAHAEDELNELRLQTFRSLIKRRAQREPLQYLTGHQEFYNLDFEVTPDVLIPRAETEIIVEVALDVCRDERAPFIADIGTGSGCIVISLLHELRDARAMATDLSLKALQVAQRNAKRHNVIDRLVLVEADGFAPPRESHEFSLIVSNPPYVTEHEFADLQPEVRDYEPRTALVSGEDGLAHIRMLLRAAPPHLQCGGYFIFEIGFGQSDAVGRLIDQELWSVIEVRKDLQNIPRTFVLRKR
jgi:release factor glutamine methyltransferase